MANHLGSCRDPSGTCRPLPLTLLLLEMFSCGLWLNLCSEFSQIDVVYLLGRGLLRASCQVAQLQLPATNWLGTSGAQQGVAREMCFKQFASHLKG